MSDLIIVSLVWAFSFGLIKKYLAGLDPALVAGLRLLLSFVVFLPWLRPRGAGRGTIERFLLLGAVQYGLMYVAYLAAFRTLSAAQVVLFTVFTPILVALLDDGRQRRIQARNLAAALLATAGAAAIVYTPGGFAGRVTGFFLVQASNLCFAAGQVYFRALKERRPQLRELQLFAIAYLGGMAAVAPFILAVGRKPIITLNLSQILVLLYLGLVASGAGFFLWNRGAARVSAGTLAVLNNLKIPLGIAASILVFGEKSNLLRLLIGGSIIMAALTINRKNAGT